MESESLDRAWDPAAPGAGALRATAIVQLYFRMTSHHPLTILVVDAMCLTFGADGVTVQELVDYLGVTPDRIRFGLEGIPAEMRCTAQQLEVEGVVTASSSSTGAEASADHNATSTSLSSNQYDAAGGGGSARPGEKEVRYYLNYKRLLPLVYAHVTRLLLDTCVTDVPLCSYVEAVKAAQLAPYSRPTDDNAHAFFATTAAPGNALPAASPATGGKPGGPVEATAAPVATHTPSPASSSSAIFQLDSTGEHVDVSDAMKRRSAIRGVYCLGCLCFFLPEEFAPTLSRCPRCGKDSLRLCIQSIQRQLNARIADQRTMVKLLPTVSQVWKRAMGPVLASGARGQQAKEGKASLAVGSGEGGAVSSPTPPPLKSGSMLASSAQQSLSCALASDPFLFQQALAFLFLYATRFASVNDAASVVDAQQILTEPEYRERLRGKASLADQFRSRHRHATSVHVRLVSQRDIDIARREDSHQKLLKRAMLPPWLRHTSALEALGGIHVYTRTAAAEAEATTAKVVSLTEGGEGEPWKSEATVMNEHAKAQRQHSGAVWKPGKIAAPTAGEKRKRPAEAESEAELTRMAGFIAAHYYEDDYDEVALPLSRARQRA